MERRRTPESAGIPKAYVENASCSSVSRYSFMLIRSLRISGAMSIDGALDRWDGEHRSKSLQRPRCGALHGSDGTAHGFCYLSFGKIVEIAEHQRRTLPWPEFAQGVDELGCSVHFDQRS